ncbi:MAG TPA: hypothetical protein VL989_01415 [Candidatus Sulfotelmatobacter sp.]|nr:hypothetical protein [Candidatus Sulfotelmatobacter sp.]
MEIPDFFVIGGEPASRETIEGIYSAMSAPSYAEGHRGREPYGVSVFFSEEDGDLDGINIWVQRAHNMTRRGVHTGCFGTSGEDIAFMGHVMDSGPVTLTQAVAERAAARLEQKRQEAERVGIAAVRIFLSSTNSVRDPNIH